MAVQEYTINPDYDHEYPKYDFVLNRLVENFFSSGAKFYWSHNNKRQNNNHQWLDFLIIWNLKIYWKTQMSFRLQKHKAYQLANAEGLCFKIGSQIRVTCSGSSEFLGCNGCYSPNLRNSFMNNCIRIWRFKKC